jgi:ABC-type uncharacterized transport system substrate-binding protein
MTEIRVSEVRGQQETRAVIRTEERPIRGQSYMTVVRSPWSVVSKAILSFTLSAMLLALCAIAEAQQPKEVPRIGFLAATSASSNLARVEAFRQGMRELGYLEGQNIIIEYRYAEDKPDQVSNLVAELIRHKVEVIVTGGPLATRPAKKATATIPIIMAFDSDPVENGFVASLARPGGNISGLSALSPEISGKQLELLKEIVPRLSRVAVVGDSNEPGNPKTLRQLEQAGTALKVRLQYLDVQSTKDIETAFRAATDGHADAALVMPSALLDSHRAEIVDGAVKNRLPVIYHRTEFVEAGGLMSYATSFTDLSHRAATYVDKILKGAKPADLPVEQPTKFELVINLKTAKQIGLNIPQSVLYRADKVIK